MTTAGGIVDRRRDLVVGALCAYLAVVTVAPVATTPDRSDDIVNRGRPQLFAASGQSVLEYLVDWVGSWVRDQGRFFPGSAVWTFAVFTTFQSRFTYKLFIAGLVLLMIALAAATVATLSTPPAAAVAIATLAAAVHLRDFFDGVDSFSGILPATVAATLACLLLLVRRRGWVTAILSVPIWVFVLLTYEVAVTLVPTLCALVWWMTRRWVRILPLLVPAVAVVAAVTVLRSHVTSFVGNAYLMNLEPERVVATYLKQAAGALPWSTQWYPGTTARMTFEPAMLVLDAGAGRGSGGRSAHPCRP